MRAIKLKNIEKFFKKIFKSLLSGTKTPVLISEPQKLFSDENIKKILLLRHDRIGDVIISRPLVKNLRKAMPDVDIDILYSSRNFSASFFLSDITNQSFNLGKKISHKLGVIRKLRKNKYDLVIDLFDNESVTSNLLIRMIKAKVSLGIAKGNSALYDYIVPLISKKEYHIIERIAQLLLPFGINPNEADLSPEYPLSDDEKSRGSILLEKQDGTKTIGIVASGSDESKYFGKENLKKLISAMNLEFPAFDIVLFAEPKYLADSDEICKDLKVRPAQQVVDVKDFSLMLASCDALILPDTSAVHFASAFSVPCVTAFKGVKSNSDFLWTSYKNNSIVVTTENDSLSFINSQELFSALLKIIK